MRLKADLTLLLVAALWGSAFAAQRLAATGGSVYFFNGARFLLAALILIPLALRHPLGPSQWWWMSAAGIILFAASALQQIGLVTTTAANAGFITAMYVVLVPFVIWIGWAERPTMLSVFAVGVATAGAYLLSSESALQLRGGDLLEALAAVFWAMHVAVVGKFASRFEPVSFSAGQLTVGGILNMAASFFFEGPALPPSTSLSIAIAYTAIFSLGLGYTLQIWGQRHTPPTDAALVLSLESVFAAAAGWLVLDEGLTLLKAIGCLLIIAAGLLSQVGRRGKIETIEVGGP